MSLMAELSEALSELTRATDSYRESGRRAAEAEAAYQKAKAIRALELKAQDNSAALISLRIKGDEAVNGYLLERECSKAIYLADRENINTLKLRIRVIEAQIEREWEQSRR